MTRMGDRLEAALSPVEERIKEIRERLLARNVVRLTDDLGRILVEQSDAAFLNQRLGPRFQWPEKYPNQSEPFISLAGALDDFNRGALAPNQRHFRRRPALVGTRALQASVFARTSKRLEVTYGSDASHAPAHQWGLLASQAISPGAKKLMRKWIRTPEGAPFASKIRFMTKPDQTTLDTEINQRPFVGITAETGDRLVDVVERYFNSP